MIYRDKITGEYPVTLSLIQTRRNVLIGPNPSKETLDALDYEEVAQKAPPVVTEDEYVVEGEPEKIDEVWTQTWTVQKREVSTDELDTRVNAERENRLQEGCLVNVGARKIYVAGDDVTKTNLQGLAFGASLRLSQGDTTTVTEFRDENNVDHPLTPPELILLWQKSAGYVSSLYQASWELKSPNVTPKDYKEDKYWPPKEV